MLSICFWPLLLLCWQWGGDVAANKSSNPGHYSMWKVCSVHIKTMQARTKSDWWFMFIQVQRTGSGLITVKWRMLICPLLPGCISIQRRSKISQEAYRYVRCCYFWTLSMHRAKQIEWLSRCLKIKTSQYLPRYYTSQTLDCSLCMFKSSWLIMEIWLILPSGYRWTSSNIPSFVPLVFGWLLSFEVFCYILFLAGNCVCSRLLFFFFCAWTLK